MSNKYYTITNGEIAPCSPFSVKHPRVSAKNKTEAAKLFLNKLENMIGTLPELHIKNRAFMLVYHNGDEYRAETGYVRQEGRQCPLCVAGHEKYRDALKEPTFDYYDEISQQYPQGSPGALVRG